MKVEQYPCIAFLAWTDGYIPEEPLDCRQFVSEATHRAYTQCCSKKCEKLMEPFLIVSALKEED